NNNTISVLGNPNPGAFAAQSNTTLSGSGKLTMTQEPYSFIQTAAGVTLTQAAGHTIDGTGNITAALVNNGLISSTTATINLNTKDKVNNGLIRSQPGHNLRISGITISQGSSGQIFADGSIVILDPAVISGGTLASANGGYFGGAVTLNKVTNNGAIAVGDMGITGGSLVNNGSIVFRGNPNLGVLEVIGDTVVTGTGTIASTQGGYSLMKIDPGFTLTNGAGAVCAWVAAGAGAPAGGIHSSHSAAAPAMASSSAMASRPGDGRQARPAAPVSVRAGAGLERDCLSKACFRRQGAGGL
ncbi:MAG: hypothetical protein WKG03_17500, partial [Telluria sp.]